MDIDDLKKFLVVAQKNNLQTASAELNVTAGALSKVIKRLEEKLSTNLFDRVGRSILLNQQGEKFRQYAIHLVHEADQAISEFSGTQHKTLVKLAGPSLLMQHYLPTLTEYFPEQQYEFNLDVGWEGQAINQVASGQSHLALVTEVALNDSIFNTDFTRIKLSKTHFKVVAANHHPIFKAHPNNKITNKQLYEFTFACPSVSPFCGVKRGIGSDGWRDDKVPRTIGFRCNDFSVLMSLVNQGIALAYVPDFIAEQPNLSVVNVVDCDYVCQEQIELVFKPSIATGWLNRFANEFEK